MFEVGAPKARVFEVVTDPHQVAGCMPDLQRVEVRSADEFDAVVRVGVSFIRGDFTLHFRTLEKEAESRVKMQVHGTGLASAVDMKILVGISDSKGGGSAMTWAADATVSGRIASLGQRLMESQAEKIIRQFFGCFREKLERP